MNEWEIMFDAINSGWTGELAFRNARRRLGLLPRHKCNDSIIT